jgi:hypothetical protein
VPTHGTVELEDISAAVPRCPKTRSKRIGGGVVVEPCGLPLTASTDQGRPRVMTTEQAHDDTMVLRAAVGCGQDTFDAISLLAVSTLEVWVNANLELAQGKVQRALDRLEADGLVECRDAVYRVTLDGHDRAEDELRATPG